VQELLNSLVSEYVQWSTLESIAVVFAVLYLLLAIRENIWCWLCAGVSTSIFVVIYINALLYMEALLNVFYLCMAIYGWFNWHQGARGEFDGHAPIQVWNIRTHTIALVATAVAALLAGYYLDRATIAKFPYIDSATTFASIWATLLVARKVLENWWYWLVIDAVSVFIYWERGLELTAGLFVVYLFMIPFGYRHWLRSRQQQMTV